MAKWTVGRTPGFRITHTFIVRNPACPVGPHPTRHCGCKVFRTIKDAAAYAERKNQETGNA